MIRGNIGSRAHLTDPSWPQKVLQVRTRSWARQSSCATVRIPKESSFKLLRVVHSPSPRLRYRGGADAKWLPRLKLLPWSWYEHAIRWRCGLDV